MTCISVLKFFNKRNTFLAENDAYGFTQLMEDVTFLKNWTSSNR